MIEVRKMETKINNIDLFKVKDNENTYYGFSQEWYKDEWQRRAGCGNYLLPTEQGLNSIKLFYDGIKSYYDDKEVTIDYINVDIKNKVSLEEIIKFICKELTEDKPLAFLNLCNGEENNLDKWHWVVVVEMFEENGEHFLNIIDDKEIIKINLSLWYRTIKNDGGFITFK